MYFSTSRKFWMQASIEAIPVASGSSRKVRARHTCVFLRDRADTMAATAAAMKRIADVADPLYKTLDDGQKRRLGILTHMEGRFGGKGWRHHGYHRGMDRDDDGRDRGFERDRYDRDGGPGRDPGKDRGDRGGPERL